MYLQPGQMILLEIQVINQSYTTIVFFQTEEYVGQFINET